MCQPPRIETKKQVQKPEVIKEQLLKPERKKVQHSIQRSEWVDYAAFCAPALFCGVTNVLPIFITGFARIFSTHFFLMLHYVFVDKDNYNNKLSQRQLARERKDYLVGTILHMWAQVVLQMIFPGMFFSPNDQIATCGWNTFLSHVAIVEPLYYFAHVWLHKPEIMKHMHSFHHLSVNTLPSTSLVQDFEEHFIYIAVFGPAFLVPFLLGGQNHWVVICAYLVLFDLINAWGHTNISISSWVFDSKWSPMRYLFYTPEFHQGHHKYYKANFGLFMPIFDHLCGTYREYKIPGPEKLPLLPQNQQNFVFIGHNGGLGHLLTCPEFSVYNAYDTYRQTWLPIQVEFVIAAMISFASSLFTKSYKVSRYLVDERYVGRVICILRTPMDYMNKRRYSGINKDIIDLMEREYKACGTRYFGLGNLNKMKQLNDGGKEIVSMIKEHAFLRDKNIRTWTGDTLTSASIYHQIVSIPNLTKLFYIGASGKIGTAVIELLVKRNIQITVYSKYMKTTHPNVTVTENLSDMAGFRHVLIGKIMNPKVYQKAMSIIKKNETKVETKFLLDYTVPFMPLQLGKDIHHIQVGVLRVGAKEDSSRPVLRGHFDVCFGFDEGHIYPCHAGCILNMLEKKETDETGDIDTSELLRLWKVARSVGLQNKLTPVPVD